MWIGMFFSESTPVPDGYMSVDIPASDVGICWIYGRQDTGNSTARRHMRCVWPGLKRQGGLSQIILGSLNCTIVLGLRPPMKRGTSSWTTVHI